MTRIAATATVLAITLLASSMTVLTKREAERAAEARAEQAALAAAPRREQAAWWAPRTQVEPAPAHSV